MSHRRWSTPVSYGHGDFNERAFRRHDLSKWDACWHKLTVEASASFLDEVKIPSANDPISYRSPPSTESARLSPSVLKELSEAGFVEVRSDQGRRAGNRVCAAMGVHDFALRVRILRRHHLLDPGQEGAVKAYVNNNYFHHELLAILMEVLRKVGINDYLRLDEALERYVRTHQWVGWVVLALGDPLAAPIVDRVVQAGGALTVAELLDKMGKVEPAAVRALVERLVSHLALFEDLDPATLELRVGMLPSVTERLIEARRPRPRPPLVVCESVKDVGPDEGFLIGDLRALLLELARAPARLRQNHSLFQKEAPRFESAIEPLPGWMWEPLRATVDTRLFESFQRAKSLKLVKEVQTGKACHLHLSPKGEEWLIMGMDDQYLELVSVFRTPMKESDRLLSGAHTYLGGIDSHGYSSRNDSRFLGANVVCLPFAKGQVPGLWERRPENHELLRRALDRIFSALPVGTYYPIDSFVAHAVFGEHNPLLLGTKAEAGQVAIYQNGQLVPLLADRLEDTAKSLLLGFLGSRLIPLGCVRVAQHEKGIALARDPRFDAYFGRRIVRESQPGAGAPESKVVVQPDYSVVIIGPSPAPAAELLPFCERTSSGSGRGAMVLKITRESVLQAIARGLPPAEVLVRLKRHASHDLPANVVREVEDWTGWVRHVALERLTVIRCPDRDTADRVMGALPKLAERVHDTIVAISPGRLTTLEHQKLLGQGIIIGSSPAAEEHEPKPKAKPKPKARQKRRSSF